jgi:hypothetical protein
VWGATCAPPSLKGRATWPFPAKDKEKKKKKKKMNNKAHCALFSEEKAIWPFLFFFGEAVPLLLIFLLWIFIENP